MVLYNRVQEVSPNKILKGVFTMEMKDELIERIAADKAREALFGCCPDCFGNMPCDNGRLCDKCSSDLFREVVEDEYSRLIKRI